MRTKIQSREERRQAIQKEIEAISTDIERVRLLVTDVVRNVECSPEIHPEQNLAHAAAPRTPSAN
ncbi:MAG: hypothetical protein IPI01_18875 [Ignavibacteriae bacterium]|nr:hypothetical protein [Ignavibacteriota bacterium]